MVGVVVLRALPQLVLQLQLPLAVHWPGWVGEESRHVAVVVVLWALPLPEPQPQLPLAELLLQLPLAEC